MAKVHIALPASFLFETVLEVRIGDINYGNHLSNDAILRLAHEARLRFLLAHNYSELDIEGCGIIMADAAICYKAEAFHGTPLRFRLGLSDFTRSGFDLVYQVMHDKQPQEVARLKTGMVFFDYQTRKVAPVPTPFHLRFAAGAET